MKKLILLLIFAFFLVSCYTQVEHQNVVEKAFPDSNIVYIKDTTFIVKDKNGNIWYVMTNSISGNIVYKRRIF